MSKRNLGWTNHYQSNTRLYKIWGTMKARCLNPLATNYEYYGGRNITVCEEWLDFVPFMDWALSAGYTEKLSLDRINSDDDYMPENCRWATPSEQSANQSVRIDSTTGYTGVTWHAKRNRWYAQIRFEGRSVFGRYFEDLLDAVIARDEFIKANNLPHKLGIEL